MDLRVKVTTEYFGEDWGDGAAMSGENIEVVSETEKAHYSIREDEPEDMIFGRTLQELSSVEKMLKMAYDCGKSGGELFFEYVEEKD